MADVHRFLALDLGAESGRGIVVTLSGGKATMEPIHRWPNRPVRLAGTLHWDVPFLFAEVSAALSICAERGIALDGISVDTWGVDFGLLDGRGSLLGNPVHYRDSRTQTVQEYSNKVMPAREVFARTGYVPWPIGSLFQLLSMQRDGSPLLGAAETFLNMPDLFHYFLTGVKGSELSILNTASVLGKDCLLATDLLERFGLPERIFPQLIEPPTVLGPLSPDVRGQAGLGEVPVIATCGHDTSAAVAAVPASGDKWAFLSCGTWSIVGALTDGPIATPQCLELDFSNQYTIGGWYLAANISGLWLVQELRRKWDTPSDPWDYIRLTAEAAKVDSPADSPLIDAADSSLLAPADMEEALLRLLTDSGQSHPSGRGGLVRCVLESLALEYNRRLRTMAQVTGQDRDVVYMVGGGIANKLLCQLTADACGVTVHAGANECTAMGNALGQALGLGILSDRDEIRQVMRDSFELTTYSPRDPVTWAEKRRRYEAVQGAGK